MGHHVLDHVRIEVHDEELMTTDHSAQDSHNGELNLEFVVLFLHVVEELVAEILRIVDHIDREEVFHQLDLALSSFSSLYSLQFSLLLLFLRLGLLADALFVGSSVFFFTFRFRITVVVIFSGLDQEITGQINDLVIFTETTRGNDVNGLGIIPDLFTIQTDNDKHGSFSKSITIVLDDIVNEVLDLFVNRHIFSMRVHSLDIINDMGNNDLSHFFILNSQQLKEDVQSSILSGG